uniref:Coiled-coil domain containing 121, retrogene 2 n=1 Tax=Cricetulus griseus TaxID=10029 RepID=A0A8C2LSE6_CRIGR
MESQGQGYPSWNTRGRRATIFPQREGAKPLGLSALPAQDEADFLTPHERRYRPPLTKKRAMCDFRVRWPEIVCREQEAQREDLPQPGLQPLDRVHNLTPFSSGGSISLKQQASSHSDFQDSQGSPAYLMDALILKNYLRPELMTRLEKRVRRRTLVAMKQLNQEMEAVRFRRAVLLKDTRELQDERAFEEAENKPLLEYLKERNERAQEKYDFLWKDYIQQSQDIKDRRRKLVSTFTSQTANLQKQLAQGRKMKAGLRKKLKDLDPIAQIKETQDREIEALELEKARIIADLPFVDQKAHFQFLKERAALEKQVEELNLLESGEDITRELKKKAKALEVKAKKAHKNLCHHVDIENRLLRTKLQQLDEELFELEARKKKLEQRTQQWKEQQWYLEALARGRQRLQHHLLDARLRTNPKKQTGAEVG